MYRDGMHDATDASSASRISSGCRTRCCKDLSADIDACSEYADTLSHRFGTPSRDRHHESRWPPWGHQSEAITLPFSNPSHFSLAPPVRLPSKEPLLGAGVSFLKLSD